jgi:RNA polymerase sigma factor for flagellar operon FliA
MAMGGKLDQSREDLVLENIALVGHLVRETMSRVPSQVNRDDLTSAGLMALVQAAQAYDATRGVPFAAYASTRIRGAILDELRGADWASRSVRRRARDLDTTRAQLAGTFGRVATAAEVATAVGLSSEEVEANDHDVARAKVISLDGAAERLLDDLPASTRPGPEAMVELVERLDYLREAVAELPGRLRMVVEEYFLAERPMAEIAERLQVTESRVSQIRAEALVLLREALHRALAPERVTASRRPGSCVDRRRQAYVDAVMRRHAAGTRFAAAV